MGNSGVPYYWRMPKNHWTFNLICINLKLYELKIKLLIKNQVVNIKLNFLT